MALEASAVTPGSHQTMPTIPVFPTSPIMAFSSGAHQPTPAFIFSRLIEVSSPTTLKRILPDHEFDRPSRKKRRLRLALTTSPLSLPFSTPRTFSQPNRSISNRNRIVNVSGALRLSPWRPLFSSVSYFPSSLSGTSSILCKAAVLNRVKQRSDAACERNPNLRWEKERYQKRELLLRKGLEMRRMAALREGLTTINSTKPVMGNSTPLDRAGQPDSERQTSVAGVAASLAYNGCKQRRIHDDEQDATAALPPPPWCCTNGYLTPPSSMCTSGFSNYDALDSEGEEKEEGGAATLKPDENANPALPYEADEGIRDIFDFLTPPAEHQTYLPFYDYSNYDVSFGRSLEDEADNRDKNGRNGDGERPRYALNTASSKQHSSLSGCQRVFRVLPQPPRSNPALEDDLRNPEHHRQCYAAQAFIAMHHAF